MNRTPSLSSLFGYLDNASRAKVLMKTAIIWLLYLRDNYESTASTNRTSWHSLVQKIGVASSSRPSTDTMVRSNRSARRETVRARTRFDRGI